MLKSLNQFKTFWVLKFKIIQKNILNHFGLIIQHFNLSLINNYTGGLYYIFILKIALKNKINYFYRCCTVI